MTESDDRVWVQGVGIFNFFDPWPISEDVLVTCLGQRVSIRTMGIGDTFYLDLPSGVSPSVERIESPHKPYEGLTFEVVVRGSGLKTGDLTPRIREAALTLPMGEVDSVEIRVTESLVSRDDKDDPYLDLAEGVVVDLRVGSSEWTGPIGDGTFASWAVPSPLQVVGWFRLPQRPLPFTFTWDNAV